MASGEVPLVPVRYTLYILTALSPPQSKKTERAAETDRPLGFRLWENAMGNRLRNPIRETEVWCLLCSRMGQVQQLGLEC